MLQAAGANMMWRDWCTKKGKPYNPLAHNADQLAEFASSVWQDPNQLDPDCEQGTTRGWSQPGNSPEKDLPWRHGDWYCTYCMTTGSSGHNIAAREYCFTCNMPKGEAEFQGYDKPAPEPSIQGKECARCGAQATMGIKVNEGYGPLIVPACSELCIQEMYQWAQEIIEHEDDP